MKASSHHLPIPLTEPIDRTLSLVLRRYVSVRRVASDALELTEAAIRFMVSLVIVLSGVFCIGLILGAFYAGFVLALKTLG